MIGTPGTMNGKVAEFLGCLVMYIRETTTIKPKMQQRRTAQASPLTKCALGRVSQTVKAVMERVNTNVPRRARRLVSQLSGCVVLIEESTSSSF